MHDRRNHQRFIPEDACIIQHEEKVGTVLDVSAGGLSCKCFDWDKCHEGHSINVNLYCKKHELCAENIKMKVLETEVIPGHFAEDLSVRKCRAKFEELAEPQYAELVDFIVKSSFP